MIGCSRPMCAAIFGAARSGSGEVGYSVYVAHGRPQRVPRYLFPLAVVPRTPPMPSGTPPLPPRVIPRRTRTRWRWPAVAVLDAQARSQGIPLVLAPFQPYARLPDVLGSADVLVVLLERMQANSRFLPRRFHTSAPVAQSSV